MSLSTQAYKGARDFYPEDKRLQKYMFDTIRATAENFGYVEYDAPVLEPVELYLSKSSEEIVAEQTYNFMDRGGRHVTMRPEMTPTLARMVAARRQELPYPLRLYSIPNLWRYERPQGGRLREYYQPNFDIFGVAGIEADHEMILLAHSIWKSFGAEDSMYEIRLNSRQLVNAILDDYIEGPAEQVLATVRLIDHKAKMPHDDFLEALAKLVPEGKHHELDHLLHTKSFADLPSRYADHPSTKELLKLKALLVDNDITNVVDDLSLMRGFDYYTDIVFEIFDTHPENNRSMAGGGRYDGLVGLFGVEPVPTVGFALGDVTLQRFLELHKLLPPLRSEVECVAILIGDVYKESQGFLMELRNLGVNLAVDMTGRKLDTAIRHAAKAGVPVVAFIGEEELKTKQVRLKHLESGEEYSVSFDDALARIEEYQRTQDA